MPQRKPIPPPHLERAWVFDLPLPVRFTGIEAVRPSPRQLIRKLKQRAVGFLKKCF